MNINGVKKTVRSPSPKKSKTVKTKEVKKSVPAVMDHDDERMVRPDTPLPTPPFMARPPPPPHQSLYQNVNTTMSVISPIPSKKSTSGSRMIPSSLAAAMLSLPWPPPEPAVKAKIRKEEEEAAMAKREGEAENQDLDNDNGNNEGCCGGKSGSCCCAGGADKGPSCAGSRNCSRKIITKNKSKIFKPEDRDKKQSVIQNEKMVINGDPRRKPGDPYYSVTVPPFGHVYTAWPGFDHAPLPNWRKKYMIAKPWPYHEQQRRFKDNSRKVSFPDQTGLLSQPSAHTDLLNLTNGGAGGNFTGRSFASLRSPSNLSTTATIPPIHINRILKIEELQVDNY